VAEYPVRATLAGVLLFVIGVAIAGGAYENYRRERDGLLAWVQADGEVVDVLTSAEGQPRPVIRFKTNTGDLIRFRPTGPAANNSYTVGEHVPVLYPAADPNAARIDRPAIRWARSIYAGVGSVILMALGAYVAWYARRRALQ
jgi:hypothetical protein